MKVERGPAELDRFKNIVSKLATKTVRWVPSGRWRCLGPPNSLRRRVSSARVARELEFGGSNLSETCRTCSSSGPLCVGTCTDLNCLCYNSFTGQRQLLWVGVCLQHTFGRRFSLVSMVSINLGIWFYGVEMSDARETIGREESQ